MKNDLHTVIETTVKKAVLIGIIPPDVSRHESDTSLDELERLAETAEIKTAARLTQSRFTPDPATFIGTGKVTELKEIMQNNEIDTAIFDHELSPSQIKNLEDALGGNIVVFDRTMLILEIFSMHADTGEGKLQADIARLRYTIPRLTGRGAEMSRLGGNSGGGMGARRGAGETKLETDRRHLKSRIRELESELQELEKRRSVMRNQREKSGIPIISVAGYTNAGKSTLMNSLTGSDILAEDKLFATLDPTTRKLPLPNGTEALLTDTVGFIRNLPHHLVEAFKATLNEVKYSDIILILNDLSDPEHEEQLKVVKELLDNLGVKNKPVINVYNKIDKSDKELISGMVSRGNVCVSALTGEGFDGLLKAIQDTIEKDRFNLTFVFPMSEQSGLNLLHRNANVLEEEYMESGVRVRAVTDAKIRNMLDRYIVRE